MARQTLCRERLLVSVAPPPGRTPHSSLGCSLWRSRLGPRCVLAVCVAAFSKAPVRLLCGGTLTGSSPRRSLASVGHHQARPAVLTAPEPACSRVLLPRQVGALPGRCRQRVDAVPARASPG